MSLVYLGSLTTGAINPGLTLTLGSALPRIQAELAECTSAVLSLNTTPPTIAANLSAAQSIVTGISAAIALGIQVPTASAQISIFNALIAAINIELGSLGFNMGASGIHAYAFAGQADGLGPSLPSFFPGGGPTDAVNALVLASSVPASWAALSAILKVS